MPPLYALTVHQAHALLRRREVSALEVTRAVLERIRQVEPLLNAYITVTEDLALQQAQEADRRIAQGEMTPLTGIPMQIKDV
ncbi:MAG: amidase family protein, partial [Dehalococcoidia bacterium]|nr:amidase family protein [Dehalococcoidia bacterium]